MSSIAQRLEASDLERLVAILRESGYSVLAPTLRDQAIVYDEIRSSGELPRGWTDEQEGGRYRLKSRGDEAYFGYNVGPQSWKKFLFASRERLWSATKENDGFSVRPESPPGQKVAFLGVRACELRAIEIQDGIFLKGPFVDDRYRLRREGACIIAVNCVTAGGTCFCASMGTGPKAETGFDLSLTEVLVTGEHYFVCVAGSELGARLLERLPVIPASDAQRSAAESRVQDAAGKMGRRLDTHEIKELLYRNFENARWDEVASRCLSCGNCTLACPTCFCSTVEDVSDLTGDHAERWRRWDSCFSLSFTHLHGGDVRSSVKSRYRQWMTHKLASWIDQFGSSGCVGCGRCITWCPVGIDLTEETAAIRRSEAR